MKQPDDMTLMFPEVGQKYAFEVGNTHIRGKSAVHS